MLTAAVQAGHDDRHAVCLTGDRLDQALEVGEVVIGREVILIAEQVVGHTVVPRIDHDEDIVAADGFLDQTLGVTALEAGALAGDDEALFFHTGRLGPLDKMLVDEGGQLFRTGAGQQTQICNTGLLKNAIGLISLDIFTLLHVPVPNRTIRPLEVHIVFILSQNSRFDTQNFARQRIFCALHICSSKIRRTL